MVKRMTKDGVVKKRRKLKTGKRANPPRHKPKVRPSYTVIKIGEGGDMANYIADEIIERDF